MPPARPAGRAWHGWVGKSIISKLKFQWGDDPSDMCHLMIGRESQLSSAWGIFFFNGFSSGFPGK